MTFSSEDIYILMLSLQSSIWWTWIFFYVLPFLVLLTVGAIIWIVKSRAEPFLVVVPGAVLVILSVATLHSFSRTLDAFRTAASTDPQIAASYLRHKMEKAKREIIGGQY